MKKFIILIVLTFLVTGCSGKYELEIYNGGVVERTTALYEKGVVISDPYDYTVELSLKYDDNGDFLSFESKKNVSMDDMVGVELKNSYSSVDDYREKSSVINYCYDARSITSNNGLISLKTSNQFNCLSTIEELDEVTIVVKTNHKLKETNADKKSSTSYYWYINKDNYQDKPISLVLYSDKKVWYYNLVNKLILIISVIGGTVLVAFIGYKFYKKREDNVNF